jgi:hypothetical protein
MGKKKCRVFTTCIGWSEVMFIFDLKTKFSDISKNPQTHMLTKKDYLGIYDFDKKFINFFNREKILDHYYYFRFSYHKDDDDIEEEQKWKNLQKKSQKNSILNEDKLF